MSIANCPRCGKIYRKVAGATICQACVDAEEECFQKVYAFLKENIEATVPEIQFATEVDEKLILRFLEDGRLMGTGAKLSTHCAGCGASIQVGRFCSACLAKKREAFTGAAGNLAERKRQSASVEEKKDENVLHQLRHEKYLR